MLNLIALTGLFQLQATSTTGAPRLLRRRKAVIIAIDEPAAGIIAIDPHEIACNKFGKSTTREIYFAAMTNKRSKIAVWHVIFSSCG